MFLKPKRLEVMTEMKLSQTCFNALNYSPQRLFNRLCEVLSAKKECKIGF